MFDRLYRVPVEETEKLSLFFKEKKKCFSAVFLTARTSWKRIRTNSIPFLPSSGPLKRNDDALRLREIIGGLRYVFAFLDASSHPNEKAGRATEGVGRSSEPARKASESAGKASSPIRHEDAIMVVWACFPCFPAQPSPC